LIVALGISAACIAYALVRYSVFKGVSLEHAPVYLLNKASSVAATIFLALSGFYAWRRHPDAAFWGRLAWPAVLLHVLLSLAVLDPGFFPGWFDEGKLNLTGQVVVLTGTLGALAMAEVYFNGKRQSAIEWILVSIGLLTLAHTAFIGAKKWIKPADWPGGMPNMSMLGAVAAAISALFYFQVLRRRETGRETGREDH